MLWLLIATILLISGLGLYYRYANNSTSAQSTENRLVAEVLPPPVLPPITIPIQPPVSTTTNVTETTTEPAPVLQPAVAPPPPNTKPPTSVSTGSEIVWTSNAIINETLIPISATGYKLRLQWSTPQTATAQYLVKVDSTRFTSESTDYTPDFSFNYGVEYRISVAPVNTPDKSISKAINYRNPYNWTFSGCRCPGDFTNLQCERGMTPESLCPPRPTVCSVCVSPKTSAVAIKYESGSGAVYRVRISLAQAPDGYNYQFAIYDGTTSILGPSWITNTQFDLNGNYTTVPFIDFRVGKRYRLALKHVNNTYESEELSVVFPSTQYPIVLNSGTSLQREVYYPDGKYVATLSPLDVYTDTFVADIDGVRGMQKFVTTTGGVMTFSGGSLTQTNGGYTLTLTGLTEGGVRSVGIIPVYLSDSSGTVESVGRIYSSTITYNSPVWKSTTTCDCNTNRLQSQCVDKNGNVVDSTSCGGVRPDVGCTDGCSVDTPPNINIRLEYAFVGIGIDPDAVYVNAVWDGVRGATSYNIKLFDNSNPGTPVQEANLNSTRYSFSALSPYKSYTITVTPQNGRILGGVYRLDGFSYPNPDAVYSSQSVTITEIGTGAMLASGVFLIQWTLSQDTNVIGYLIVSNGVVVTSPSGNKWWSKAITSDWSRIRTPMNHEYRVTGLTEGSSNSIEVWPVVKVDVTGKLPIVVGSRLRRDYVYIAPVPRPSSAPPITGVLYSYNYNSLYNYYQNSFNISFKLVEGATDYWFQIERLEQNNAVAIFSTTLPYTYSTTNPELNNQGIVPTFSTPTKLITGQNYRITIFGRNKTGDGPTSVVSYIIKDSDVY
jgi:hypothetical protein